MKSILGFVIILAVVVGGIGAYQGWFSYSKEDGFVVNQEKVKQDATAAKDAAVKAGKKVADATAKGLKKTKEWSSAALSKGKEWAKTAAASTKAAMASLSDKAKGAYSSLKSKLTKDETGFVGSVESINADEKTITVKLANGETMTYPLADDADIQLNSGVSAFADLGTGDEAAIAIDADGKVVKVFAAR